ncbi:hypothetical protein [Mesorhizobium loti]|uniref:Uncharacterized protein n=1 Tax=Rhizobium loti TaxID=381 RepID=A0A6M7U6N8_RHILI|nr:hypothetical protein [Mesorhizobium loti]OBQ72368.1 hypothetical protein A8145_06030 [Mesorhizobium loti]QKC72028.1 hypothetical protein EB815_24930 [Mesorhizobium loti]
MIKTRLSSPSLADRGARLAGVGFSDRLVPRQVGAADYEFPAAPVPQEPDRAEPAAPSVPLPGGAAFSRFADSCPSVRGQDKTAPAAAATLAGADSSNAMLLPDHVMVLVRAVAAYERCTNERAVALALTEYATMIGAGALARAVADLGDELADIPAHARHAANRFRGGGP